MRTKVFIIVALCLALASTLFAQDPAAPPSRPEVSLSLIVTDKNGKRVDTISKDQIHVFENKVEQTILSIDADERPVDCVVAIDTSGSLRSEFGAVLEASRLLIINRRPVDQIAITRFVSSDRIEKVHEFSTDTNALVGSLNGLRVEAGQSAVIDAFHYSAAWVADHNKANEGRRKVVVIITDGEDRNSNYREADLIKLLREQGVQVFILGLVVNLSDEPSMIRSSPLKKAQKLLRNVAEESGGRVFFPRDKEELLKSVAGIILDLRGQFRIEYQSTTDDSTKGFRNVDVKFVSTDGEKRNLIVPRGYYVGPPPKKSEKKS